MFPHRTQVSTNAFVGAYIDRLLEQQQLASGKGRSRTAGTVAIDDNVSDDDGENRHQRTTGTLENQNLDDGLSFGTFVHIFWVFSAWASRAEKEEG